MASPLLSDLPFAPPGKIGWPWTEGTSSRSDAMPSRFVLPRVSIVTPSFNQGHFIEETIRSVLLQGYPNLEYIVIDGGSTDGSVDIIRKYAAWLKFWVSEPDRGQADALNKGFAHATGDIFAWLNSDDVYRSHAVEVAAKRFGDPNKPDIVCGACDLIDEQGCIFGILAPQPFDLARQLIGNPIAQPATFFRRAVFEAIGGFNPARHFAFDYEFWLQAALRGFRFAVLPAPPLAGFRMWNESKSEGSALQFVPETLAILDEIFADGRLPARLRGLKPQAQAGAWRFAAHGSYRAGRMTATRECIHRMIRLYPRSTLDPEVVSLYTKTWLGQCVTEKLRLAKHSLVEKLFKS